MASQKKITFHMDLICGKPVFPQRFFFRLQLPSKAPTALTWSDFLTNCQLAVGAWLAPQRCLTHALFCTHLYYIIISQPAAAWSSRCNFYPVLVSWRRRDHRRHRKDRFCWTGRAKLAAFPTSWTAGCYLSFVHFSFLEETTAKIFHSPVWPGNVLNRVTVYPV